MDELNNAAAAPPLPPEVKDYAFFREKGIELIQKLSNRNWTDHNVHDPGITVLEQLCYILTDLSYRTNFPIPGLMARQDAPGWAAPYRPGLMLSSGPATLQDWRKVLIDTEGVRNAWIYPLDTASEQYDSRVFYDRAEQALRMSPPKINRDAKRTLEPLSLSGLYRVAFIPEANIDPAKARVTLRQRLLRMRNLCEDFHQIDALAPQLVELEATVEIGQASDPAQLMADIYFAVQNYLSPRIKFYTLQERLEAGHRLEGLLEGPLLDYGFLDDEELDAFRLRRSVRVSDILRLIMSLEGVRAVQSLRISLPGTKIAASTQKGEPWELLIPDGHAPSLKIPPPPAQDARPAIGVAFVKNGLPFLVDWKTSCEKLQGLNQAEKNRTKSLPQETDKMGPAPGRYRQAGKHQSIQHQFPELYGIGEVGLSEAVSPRRSAQARQFKAYLAIFDQVLAAVFAQLEGAGKLFSLTMGATEKTYFSQSMRGEIPGLEPLIRWEAFGLSRKAAGRVKDEQYNLRLQEWAEGLYKQDKNITEEEKKKEASPLWDRRNRLLNHLLARFGEQLDEHDEVLKRKLFLQKETMLNQYALLGRQRAKAFDYTQPYFAQPAQGPEAENLSGLERRLALLLGFPQPFRRRLSLLEPEDAGGFHLVEHILLRPGVGDQGQQSPILQLPASPDERQPPQKDPFSLQLSFIFPNWLNRFDEAQNPGFRKAIVRTLREETPAHLRIFVRWLGRPEMARFERTFGYWMDQLKNR